MPIAYLTTKGLKAYVSGERIEVELPDDKEDKSHFPKKHWIPLIDVEHVVLDSAIQFSSKSIAKLLSRGVPVLFMSHGTFPAGIAVPFNPQHLFLANQLDACRDQSIRLQLARQVVESKIINMRRVIQRLSANRSESNYPSMSWLKAMANQASACQSIDSLRGIEGAASGRYFEELNHYFPAELPFERRSRRPPQNEVNALLSFLYVVVATEITMHLLASGLQPGWGFYHETENGRDSLALDLLEPFRAPLCDSLALDLINHRRLNKDDFEHVEGGVLLKRDSRRTVLLALENRFEREFQLQQTGNRTTLRGIIKDHCQMMKNFFVNQEPVEFFRMN